MSSSGGATGAGAPADRSAGPAADPAAGRTFEEIVDELEALTEQLAGGQVGIEAAADLYERAERLHAAARARLAAVQARVERLSPPPA